MIQQEQLPKMVQDTLPDLREDLRDAGVNPHSIIKLLRQHTVTAALRHNYNRVRQCLVLADRLHNEGCAAIRNAIANTYIYAVDRMMAESGYSKKWAGLIPRGLYQLYLRQMFQSGI